MKNNGFNSYKLRTNAVKDGIMGVLCLDCYGAI